MRQRIMSAAIDLAERGAPDPVVRWGMRRAIGRRLSTENGRSPDERLDWLADWHSGPVAPVPELANAQHYEVPAAFFELVLGPRLKYSSCLWPEGVDDLAGAEEAMLAETCRTAGIEDGMRILELGSGWGSLSLWIAEHYPESEILTVSNSASQGRFIEERAAALGAGNIEHVVADVNQFDAGKTFDCVVSVEMLEHVRNHRVLLERVASWLEDGGVFFVHVFAHRELFWPFEDRGAGDWMAREFFSGGIMPSHDYFERFDHPFDVDASNWIDGTHYARTLDAWLERFDDRRDEVRPTLAADTDEATERRLQRWRMFFMACSELFGFDGGTEFGVSHHRLRL